MRGNLLRILMHLIAMLPLPVLRFLGRQLGWFNALLGTRSAKVTRANIALCLPELSAREARTLERGSLRHTGQTLMETPAVWLGSLARTNRWIDKVENEELLDSAMASGKGTIILLPHLGNWEMFNIYFRRKGVMTALYQPPRQDWLKPLMQVVRGKAGNELVATNVKGLAKLYRTLSEAGVVTILPDQVPQVGVYANFFNHAALTDRLVPRLIQKTGARVVVCIVYRNAGKFNVRFSEVDDALYEANMDTALGGLNRSIELAINDYLPQYQWEYKRFRERPAGEKKIYKFNGENRYHE